MNLEQMGRLIAIFVLSPLVVLAGIWVYRLTGTHLSEAQAGDKALISSQDRWGPREEVVINAKFYDDASKLVDSHGSPVNVTLSGCPSWFPTPTASICPPIAVWAVRVHVPGKLDEVVLVDANTGATVVLLPAMAPSTG